MLLHEVQFLYQLKNLRTLGTRLIKLKFNLHTSNEIQHNFPFV